MKEEKNKDLEFNKLKEIFLKDPDNYNFRFLSQNFNINKIGVENKINIIFNLLDEEGKDNFLFMLKRFENEKVRSRWFSFNDEMDLFLFFYEKLKNTEYKVKFLENKYKKNKIENDICICKGNEKFSIELKTFIPDAMFDFSNKESFKITWDSLKIIGKFKENFNQIKEADLVIFNIYCSFQNSEEVFENILKNLENEIEKINEIKNLIEKKPFVISSTIGSPKIFYTENDKWQNKYFDENLIDFLNKRFEIK